MDTPPFAQAKVRDIWFAYFDCSGFRHWRWLDPDRLLPGQFLSRTFIYPPFPEDSLTPTESVFHLISRKCKVCWALVLQLVGQVDNTSTNENPLPSI